MPILESSITLIADGRLYYRGHDAITLAATRSVREVAALIWTGAFDAALDATPLSVPAAHWPDDDLPFVARAQAMLSLISARDAHAFDLRSPGVAASGWRILELLTRVAARTRKAASPRGHSPALEHTLSRAWGVGARGEALIRAALILSADHELNVSSFTARCVASAGSSPHAVVIAGLAAIEGSKHGGISARVESTLAALVASTRRGRSVRAALAERLRRGEPIDGFGHPLYRDGDPRATAIFDLLDERYARSRELAFVRDVAAAAGSVLREHPTIDFALAGMARVLRLPPGSPLTLFALGRTIGWVGHAIEQYATGQIIRPRAKYTGNTPISP